MSIKEAEGQYGNEKNLYTEDLTKNSEEVQLLDNQDVIKSIPRWHFGMLNDVNRNISFGNGINMLELSGKTVLDIGSGTGLLAMHVARNNAKHVYTVEANPYIAKIATDIIKKNNLQDKITVINKISTDLIPGVDLPADIEVLISETVDCGFFGEGFVPSLRHAREVLLAKDAIILPSSVKLVAGLLSSQDVRNLNQVTNALDFDISMFNTFSTQGYFPVRLNSWENKLVSNEVMFYERILSETDNFKQTGVIDFVVTENAVVDGVVFWFELTLVEEGVMITNSPDNKTTHWMQAVQIFDHSINVVKGESCSVKYTTSDMAVDFEAVTTVKSQKS